jgi:hypothetical protein
MTADRIYCRHCSRRIVRDPALGNWLHAGTGTIRCPREMRRPGQREVPVTYAAP